MAIVNQPTVIPTLQIGSRVFTDLTNLITLSANVSSTASQGRTTLRKLNASAGYQVTAGKTFTVAAALIFPKASMSNYNLQLLYADNDVGTRSNTAFTNAFYACNDNAATAMLVSSSLVPANGYLSWESVIGFQAPATKYLSIDAGVLVDCVIKIYGYET